MKYIFAYGVLRLRLTLTNISLILLVGFVGGWSQESNAVQLTMPDLPAGCHYTQQSLTPLSGLYRIETYTPLFTPLKDGGVTPVLSVGVACSALSIPLPLAFNLTGAPNWQGPDNDILPTSTEGIGVKLFFDAQYSGNASGVCQSSGVVHAGVMGNSLRGTGCVLPVNTQPQEVRLNLRAQLVKTSQKTPMQFNGVVSLAGSDLVVRSNHMISTVAPWMTPSLYTEAGCTLSTPKEQFIDFGQVLLPRDHNHTQVLAIYPQPVDIGVRCQPLWDNSKNNYNVDITFDGKARTGLNNVVATSRDDLGISVLPVALNSLRVGSSQGLMLRHPMAMDYVPDKSDLSGSYFFSRYLLSLNYYPSPIAQGGGNFKSVITYTITINH